MMVKSATLLTPGGVTLYSDDLSPTRFYVMPSGLGVASRSNHKKHFTLLYYQEDHPDRGARLTAAFAPVFPAVQLETTPGLEIGGAQVEGIAFNGGEVEISWEGMPGPSRTLNQISAGVFRVDLSLSQEQARNLKQILKSGASTVRVQAHLTYETVRAALPARARFNLRQIHQVLKETTEGETLPGLRIRQSLANLPAAALQVQSDRGNLSLQPAAMEDLAGEAAPMIAARIAHSSNPSAIFDRTLFTLSNADNIPEGEFTIDLSKPGTRQDVWDGEWSLSEFYRECQRDHSLPEYFPEVLHLAAVGQVDLLVENLLPMDGRCFDQVSVWIAYKRLGSLSESTYSATFGADSSSVVRFTIPHIAMTEFQYRYHVQIRLAVEDRAFPGQRLFPSMAEWKKGHDPILRVGLEGLPWVLGFVQVMPQVFDQAARAEIEISAIDEEPQALKRISLSRSESYAWVLLDRALFAGRKLRWRPILHQQLSDQGPTFTGPWQSEQSLVATVTLAHVYPKEPLRIQATAQFSQVQEVEEVRCQLTSGMVAPQATITSPDLECVFHDDATRPLVLWPETIFDDGFSYRYGIWIQGTNLSWTAWRHQRAPKLIMNIQDDFYAVRHLRVTVTAPWSQKNGPDPMSRDPELIFVELHLRTMPPGESQSTSFTFDKTNRETEVTWKIRSRKGENRVQAEVIALSADGRMLNFGPFDTTQDRLAVEIYRTRVADNQPAEFAARLKEA